MSPRRIAKNRFFGFSRGAGYMWGRAASFARKHPPQLLPVTALPIEPKNRNSNSDSFYRIIFFICITIQVQGEDDENYFNDYQQPDDSVRDSLVFTGDECFRGKQDVRSTPMGSKWRSSGCHRNWLAHLYPLAQRSAPKKLIFGRYWYRRN